MLRNGCGMWALTVALGCAWSDQARADDNPAASSDAVILKWDQTWEVRDDGSRVYHERKDVQINNDRAHGEFVDPRITFNAETDKVNVISARTRLPNRDPIEVPDYSRNEVSPGGPAGWPAFSMIRQLVLTYSGIEPGCVVELEYEVITAKGGWSELAGDVRMSGRYMINRHDLAVNTNMPIKSELLHSKIHLKVGQAPEVIAEEVPTMSGFLGNSADGVKRITSLGEMPLVEIDEPQCPPWQAIRPRMVFSAHTDTAKWCQELTSAVEGAALESSAISKLATEWTSAARAPGEKIRALQEKLSATFNFVDFPITWRNPRAPRKAGDVLAGSYGVPEEAAGLLLALARSCGLKARPGLLVSESTYRDAERQDGFVSGFVLLVETGAGSPEIWHPQFGRVLRDKRWAGSLVFSIGANGMDRTTLPAWDNADDSQCRVAGDVTLAKDGSYTAKLRLRATGLFAAGDGLRTSDQQKARAGELVGRVVPNADVTQFTVRALSGNEFEADLDLKSRKPVAPADGFCRFTLPQDDALLGETPLPLTYATRKQPVRLAGACDEHLELAVHYPEGWSVESTPQDIEPFSRAGSTLEQTTTRSENQVTLNRHIRLDKRDLDPTDFLALRTPLNQLRSEAGRTVLLGVPK